MLELAQQIEMLAATDRTTVLLVGEAGTGKGRMAELIHEMSPRANRALLEASCVAASADALEAELFGTDGAAPRPGVLELADGGTLFLADIGEVPLALQPRLLRVLDGGRVRRPGFSGEIAVDVRLIAATTADLASAVTSGELREDLYYRLSVMPVHLPPLRARAREDMLALVVRVLADLHTQLPGAPAEAGEGALEMLLRYSWPGNLRELRNVLERAMIMARGQRRIGVEHLPDDVRRATGAGVAGHVPRTIEEVERAHIERTLKVHGGNRTRASRELGISRATLINKIKTFALDAERVIPVTRVDAPPQPARGETLPEAGSLPAGESA
jgi:transcriptional regulator with PAS, ATPase and Fis domain